MPVQAPDDLIALGWSRESWDPCWLECSEPGFVRQVHGKVICLCAEHARFLEAGRYRGVYEGAPLPAFTKHPAWPWRDPAEMADDVPGDAQDADPEPVEMGEDASQDGDG